MQSHRTVRDSNGAVQFIRIWSARSLLICSVFGSRSLYIVSLLTGEVITELNGHTGFHCALDVNVRDGIIYSGSTDTTVRVWNSRDCVPNISLSTHEDPVVGFLESKISSATDSLGAGSRSNLKYLYDCICEVLAIKPMWRRGVISSFFDGNSYSAEPRSEIRTLAVEVLFDDASVQLYSNRILIRNRDEIHLAPVGPPKWARPQASLVLGAEVAIFDIDPSSVGLLCSRFLGVSSSHRLLYDDCAMILERLIPASARESFDVKSALVALKVERDTSIDVSTLVRRICFSKERHVSTTDRLLCGHSAPVLGINFLSSSNLLVSTDMDGVCCVWDPFSQKVMYEYRTFLFSLLLFLWLLSHPDQKKAAIGSSEFSAAAVGVETYALVSRVALGSYCTFKLRVKSVHSLDVHSNQELWYFLIIATICAPLYNEISPLFTLFT